VRSTEERPQSEGALRAKLYHARRVAA
jgi:hypothetical protein